MSACAWNVRATHGDVVLIKIKTLALPHGSEVDRIQAIRLGRHNLWLLDKQQLARKTHRRRLMTQETPLHGCEPLVLLDFTSTRVGSYPFMLVLDKQLFDSRLAHAAELAAGGLLQKTYLVTETESGKVTSCLRTLANVALRSEPLKGVVANCCQQACSWTVRTIIS
jgi:hypothetical protein